MLKGARAVGIEFVAQLHPKSLAFRHRLRYPNIDSRRAVQLRVEFDVRTTRLELADADMGDVLEMDSNRLPYISCYGIE